MATKLRKRETLGFRPENEAQELAIRSAQKLAGGNMADFLRRSVLYGMHRVVEESQRNREETEEIYKQALRESCLDPSPQSQSNRKR